MFVDKKTDENDNEEFKKRRALTDGENGKIPKVETENLLGTKISQHYNMQSLLESNKEVRKESRIYNLRNFNNFIKSILISSTVKLLRAKFDEIDVLDLCCGKGGDIFKWIKADVRSVNFVDIAKIAVDECYSRVCKTRAKFSSKFIVGDVSKSSIWKESDMKERYVNLTSCQFALHYGFESIEQAHQILKNACDHLVVGGYFLGIVPNSYEIVKRLRTSSLYKTEILNLSCDGSTISTDLFGAKYNFQLEGVVNCPEFLVYFPLLERMLLEFNMKCVLKTSLQEFLLRNIGNNTDLQKRMKPFKIIDKIEVLNNFPDYKIDDLDYSHLRTFIEKSVSEEESYCTLSKEEWEVASLYTVFSFEKLPEKELCWDPLISLYVDPSKKKL